MTENNSNILYYNYGMDDGSAQFNRAAVMEGMVDDKINELKGNAPENLDTLEELADAVQNGGGDVSELVERIDTIEENMATKEEVNEVKTSVEQMLQGAPEELDTLKEIADLLATKQDANAVVEALSTKADKTTVDEMAATLAEKADKSELPDMENYALKNEIPDVSEFITETALEGYAKTEDLEDYQPKGEYLTSESLSDYALKSDIEGFATTEEMNTALDGKMDNVELAAVATSGSYNDLEDTPEIPSLDGYAKMQDIPDVSNFITVENAENTYQPKGDYATENDLESYAKKEDIPTVPENVSSFTNDANYITGAALSDYALKSDIPSVDGLATTQYVDDAVSGCATQNDIATAIGALVIPTVPTNVSDFTNDAGYLTENDLANYALKSEIPDAYTREESNNIFVSDSAFEDAINTKADKTSLEDVVLDLSRRLNKLEATNNYLIENNTDSADDINNMSAEDAANADITVSSPEAIEALSTPKTFKSISVVGAELGDDTVITLNATEDVNVSGLTVSGEKGTGNGKVNYATNEINIDSVDINPGCTVYNVFEGSQDKDTAHCIDKFTAKNITVNDVDLTHNVFNIYQLNNNAVVEISDSYFNLDVANSNVLRLSNITNADNVTVTFNNVDLTYENKPYSQSDVEWAGLVIYQPYGSDVAYNNDNTHVSTWTFNFINCRYNGVHVTENEVGTIRQLFYQYNVNGQGSCESPTLFPNINIE